MTQIMEKNSVRIVRTSTEFVIGMTKQPDGIPINVEVKYRGKTLQRYTFNPCIPLRESLEVDLLKCSIQAKSPDGTLLCELTAPANEEPCFPYMVRDGEQHHITESYVAVPPALIITDEVGAIWTLGVIEATPDYSPDGEYAFSVLRDGVNMGEIASRIERRSGKIKIFTRHGMKIFNGRCFI